MDIFIVTVAVTERKVACQIVTPSGQVENRMILNGREAWQSPDAVRSLIEDLIIRMYPGVKGKMHGSVETYRFLTDNSSVFAFRVETDS